MRDFTALSKSYPLQIRERTANRVRASFEGRNVTFTEDFTVRYELDGKPSLEVLTYRNPPEPGFFQASALLTGQLRQVAGVSPRTVIALFDNSLSMQWEKLERNFQALESLLRSLRPADRFNLLLFNTDVTPLEPAPVAATPPAIEKALAFVRGSRLRGGTNMQQALEAALGQTARAQGEAYLVLLSDGGATRGIINNGKLADWYTAKWKQAAARPRTFVFAVGDDANAPLLKMLARNEGLMEWVRSTEPEEFKLNAFLSKIGRQPVEGLKLTATPPSAFDLVYPLQDSAFLGSTALWVGQYSRPEAKAAFDGRGPRSSR